MVAALMVTIVFIAIGMAPTLISYFVVRRAGNRGSNCILLFNLAGLLPVLGQVWQNPAGSSGVLGDIFAWYVIYMLAALGVAVVWLSPQLANTFLLVFAGRRRLAIKSRQEELYKEWGSAIVGNAESK